MRIVNLFLGIKGKTFLQFVAERMVDSNLVM